MKELCKVKCGANTHDIVGLAKKFVQVSPCDVIILIQY